MDTSEPVIKRFEWGFSVLLFPEIEQAQSVKADLILDFDHKGRPVAIEILWLYDQTKLPLFDSPRQMEFAWNSGLRYSYDDAIDALWLSFGNEQSVRQQSVAGRVLADAQGRFLGVEVEYMDSSPSP